MMKLNKVLITEDLADMLNLRALMDFSLREDGSLRHRK